MKPNTNLYLLEVAILLLTANWFIGTVLLIGQKIVLAVRINNEENTMIEKFGDAYRAYMQTTQRFVPGWF